MHDQPHMTPPPFKKKKNSDRQNNTLLQCDCGDIRYGETREVIPLRHWGTSGGRPIGF